MPAVSQRQARFFRAELGRARHGQKTQTGLGEAKIHEFVHAKKSAPESKGTPSTYKHLGRFATGKARKEYSRG